jgi:MtN3 and saliva related transmembrane protein
MEHTYHINDHVSRQIDGPQGREVVEQSNVYTILALLPVEADGRLRYRIKSKEENFERIVTEDALSHLNWAVSLPMQYGSYILGMLAAALTSLSYLPQLQKAIPRNSTSDLSLKMLVALSTGLSLWVVYGVAKDDWVIILANSIGATLSLAVFGFKIRDLNSWSRRFAKYVVQACSPKKPAIKRTTTTTPMM